MKEERNKNSFDGQNRRELPEVRGRVFEDRDDEGVRLPPDRRRVAVEKKSFDEFGQQV